MTPGSPINHIPKYFLHGPIISVHSGLNRREVFLLLSLLDRSKIRDSPPLIHLCNLNSPSGQGFFQSERIRFSGIRRDKGNMG